MSSQQQQSSKLPPLESCPMGEHNYQALQSLQQLVQNNAMHIAVINTNIEKLLTTLDKHSEFETKIALLEAFKKSYEEKHKRLVGYVVMLFVGVLGALIQGYLTMPKVH